MRRSEKKLPRKTNFSTFLEISCSNFRLKLLKALELLKLLKKLSLKRPGASWKRKTVRRDNHEQNL